MAKETETVVVPTVTATVQDESGKVEVKSGAEAKKLIDKALDAPNTPTSMRTLAEDLPEKDEVQKAVKAAMLADNPHDEVKEKVKVVKASPDAEDTPSGYALTKVAGVTSHTERAEKYARYKSAKRWGTITVEDV